MWNASEVGRSLGEAHTTVKRHLDVLTGALMVRQIKSPKVYRRDSGLRHHLLGVESFRALEGHPKICASWEGLVVEHTVRIADDRNVYFWGTQSGLTKSMHASSEVLPMADFLTALHAAVKPGGQRVANACS